MADILIFGMKMPENEPLRLVLNPNGQIFVDHGVTFTEYEAVELPEHGDLIEKKTALAALYSDYAYAAMDIIEKEVPVVIPANKEETE